MRSRSTISVPSFGRSALAVAVAVFFAVVAAGGTYALWSDSATVPGATITAGSATLAVTSPAGIASTQLYPGGGSAAGEFSVGNTGDVTLALRVDALDWPSAAGDPEQQAFVDSVTVSVWPKTGDACSTTPPASAWTPASSSDSLGIQLETGAVQNMCITGALRLDAPNTAQGGTLDFHLTLGGVQV